MLMAFPMLACGSNDKGVAEQDNNTPATAGKALVVYFSCTNITKDIAEKIATAAEADIHAIIPAEPYTAADLDYRNENCRANKEQNNDAARPALSSKLDGVGNYDTVYVGFPVWWAKMPKVMFTFFEAYDFSGKTIIPFCTSGSSSIANSVEEIKSLEPKAMVKEGKRFNAGASQTEVNTWVNNQK